MNWMDADAAMEGRIVYVNGIGMRGWQEGIGTPASAQIVPNSINV
jgi:hypothetical protein